MGLLFPVVLLTKYSQLGLHPVMVTQQDFPQKLFNLSYFMRILMRNKMKQNGFPGKWKAILQEYW